MSGIEYIVEDLANHPKCAHGPSLLFSQLVNDTKREVFYACSAYRDRKFCSFFHRKDERISEDKQKMWKKEAQKFLGNTNHRNLYILLNDIQREPENDRVYCYTCSTLVLSKFKHKHSDHNIKTALSNQDLSFPTTWLKPLDHPKKEAQYLFSESGVKTIMDILINLKIRNVLCIGTPRIHENIQSKYSDMSSLLLDIDHRYHSFFGPLQFCWYNLFNNHLFIESSRQILKDFLQTDKGDDFAIIMDPPFGGRTEPIAQTISNITKQYQVLNKTNKTVPVFLFFPYFMEPQISNSLPDYKMCDYTVDYDNHSLFNKGPQGRKFGSPVRFFTNISLSKIKLPEDENYRYCAQCDRWVYKENKHCESCNACTSKDGRTYKHCDNCNRCVKPTWEHCTECNRCAQTNHKCINEIPFIQKCFHCKERGHKKRNCPKVNHDELKRKRDDKAFKISKSKRKKLIGN